MASAGRTLHSRGPLCATASLGEHTRLTRREPATASCKLASVLSAGGNRCGVLPKADVNDVVTCNKGGSRAWRAYRDRRLYIVPLPRIGWLDFPAHRMGGVRFEINGRIHGGRLRSS